MVIARILLVDGNVDIPLTLLTSCHLYHHPQYCHHHITSHIITSHHYITSHHTSLHHHIAHYHITTSLHHYITHHYITTSLHHHSFTSSPSHYHLTSTQCTVGEHFRKLSPDIGSHAVEFPVPHPHQHHFTAGTEWKEPTDIQQQPSMHRDMERIHHFRHQRIRLEFRNHCQLHPVRQCECAHCVSVLPWQGSPLPLVYV